MDKNGIVDVAQNGNPNELLQQEHYYPFGMGIKGEWKFVQPQIGGVNKYQYNGKELNDDYDLNWNDYGARWYDASIARWNGVDPLAENYSNWSGYNYVLGNPLKYIDPDGMAPKWIPEVENITDANGTVTSSRLVARMEAGDNAASLANFLNISEQEASQLFNQQQSGRVVIPNNIAGNINDALADVINPVGNDYVDNFYIPNAYETNYNCWESSLSLGEGNTPTFDNTIDQGIEFARELLDNYENVSDNPEQYIFGRTVIRFAVDHERSLGGTWNETTHGANYLGTSNDGTIYIWTKDGRITAPRVSTLQEAIDMWGEVQGAGPTEDEGGFYNNSQ